MRLKKIASGSSPLLNSAVGASDIAGLGILAIPSIQKLRGKKMDDHTAHKYELAGLGTLGGSVALGHKDDFVDAGKAVGRKVLSLVKRAGWFGFGEKKKKKKKRPQVPNRFEQQAGTAAERAAVNGVVRKAAPQLTGMDRLRALQAQPIEPTALGARKLLTKISSRRGLVDGALSLFEE